MDANGAPLTGPVSVGQTIQFVLSYKPSTSPSGAVFIDDTLSNLTYVAGSLLMPPGWTANPLAPYSVANHTQYTHAGFGPGMSFVVNVPVANLAQAGSTGGDGTLPIPAGNQVYEIYHHENYGQAQINCLNLLSLTACGGVWPRSLGAARTTPMVVRTAVAGGRIYYPSARYDSGPNTTYFGMGCWDTATEAPCPFVDLPGTPSLTGQFQGSSGATALDPKIAGVVADPGNANRLFMFAIDRVYCVDATSGAACAGWSPATVAVLPSSNQIFDMIAGEAPFADRLYVQYGGPSATVLCVDISLNGARCNPWGTGATDPVAGPTGRYGLLSLVPNGSGAIQAVCVHPFFFGGPSNGLSCFDAANGASYAMQANFSNFPAAMNSRPIFAAFHIPGLPSVPGSAGRVLYPQGVDPATPYCFDFGANAACSPFTVGWPWSTYQVYGYAVDPAQPDRCLLGLGNGGVLWRLTRGGGFGPATGCTAEIKAKFDINSFFCAVKPKEPKWGSIVIKGRPPVGPGELTSGTITLTNSLGATVSTITVGAANTYPVNILATGANSQLTMTFVPTYASGTTPNGYQLELTFTSDVDPQICYKATAECGPVSNRATMTGSIIGAAAPVPVSAKAGVNLGNATGPSCEPGLLKVCKVAGPGVKVGASYTFTVGSSTLTVPAGPAPGGTCVIGPTFPIGSNVAVVETPIPPGDTVSGITVSSPSQLVGTPNLAGGSVNVTIEPGVTEVTFIDKRTGFLEICKKGEVTGTFRFTVNPGGLGPFAVPAGACSPAIEVVAGDILNSELPSAGTAMAGCTTLPAARQGLCNLAAQTSTVTVVPGNLSTMTIAIITDRRVTGVRGPP